MKYFGNKISIMGVCGDVNISAALFTFNIAKAAYHCIVRTAFLSFIRRHSNGNVVIKDTP